MNKVAILLSTYNGAKYIEDFLKSIELQSHQNYDLFVRDDGSVDDTLKIVNAYSERIKIFVMEDSINLGPAKSFLRILEFAGSNYDFYMFADQDDWWCEKKIENACFCIENLNFNGPVMYCSRLELVDEDLNHIKFSKIPSLLKINNALVENIATGCTIAMNNSARSLIISKLPSKVTMHDWWVYIVVSYFGKVIYDNSPLIKYRQHSSNVIGGSVGPIADYVKRLRRVLNGKKEGVLTIADQAVQFHNCYESLLSESFKSSLELLFEGKHSVIKRLRLALFSDYYRQNLLDTFFLRVLFLINKY